MTLPRRYATCPDCNEVMDAPNGWEFTADTIICDECYIKRYGRVSPRFDEDNEEYEFYKEY